MEMRARSGGGASEVDFVIVEDIRLNLGIPCSTEAGEEIHGPALSGHLQQIIDQGGNPNGHDG